MRPLLEPARFAYPSAMRPDTITASRGGAAVKVFVPGPLRTYCGGAREIALSAATVRATLDQLERDYPYLYNCVCDETGAIRRHINVFVNSEHIRDRDGLETELVPGDTIIILPAVSGG
jgi:molybdopterin synthase sulfur carrier subunit